MSKLYFLMLTTCTGSKIYYYKLQGEENFTLDFMCCEETISNLTTMCFFLSEKHFFG